MCMPWLNWSLKLHIRLRTISLLISTHNTQVYVQWMPYSFVWLYLLKCVFTCSIFVDSNTKKFFSVLGFFGKYFVFTKIENFQKQYCPILATQLRVIQVASTAASSRVDFGDLSASERSSREGYTEIFAAQLATPSRVDLPIAKNTLKIFHNFDFKSFGSLPWRLVSVVKNACFCVSKTVSLNFFFSFSLDFLWLFTIFPISFSAETDPNTPQTPFLHHFFSNLHEKVMGFLCLTSFSIFWVCFSCFCECIIVIMFLKSVMLVQGFTLTWWLFIVWELVFLNLLLVFICSLGSVHCFMIVVVSFISCLWYSVTLFVIWILVMLCAHLILSY